VAARASRVEFAYVDQPLTLYACTREPTRNEWLMARSEAAVLCKHLRASPALLARGGLAAAAKETRRGFLPLRLRLL